MNPYQAGLVPMMMPQPYMVAVRLPPGMAAPQRAGQSAALLPGMPLTAAAAAGASRFPTPPPGAVQASALQAAALTGIPTTLSSSIATSLTAPQALTSAQPQMSQVAQMQHMSQMLQLDPNALKLAYSADPSMAAAAGSTAAPLTQPPGFCFVWAGARATHGVKAGKVYYEVQIVEHLPTDFGDDHQEKDPHILRVGWSIDDSSFQLGEEPFSYGYGGTARFSQNNRFTQYGEKFGHGDIIGALLDLDSKPPTISYTKNGTWLGIAHSLHGFPVGEKALFPHILTKNIRFKANFGQEGQWYPPPPGYNYLAHSPEKIPGRQPPAKKSDCEMIMIIGLPGAGKTTFGMKMQKDYPEKRYNIIGTDTLIDKMKVMGLPRKNNYHGRWDVLIDKATKCLNKLFEIAKSKHRNYILDQTNVYPSARRRKMKNFQGFYRRACILQPDDSELQRRSEKRTVEDGKYVPESAVIEMKANFKLPEDNDPLFDSIEYVELGKRDVQVLLDRYNVEGRQNQAPGQGRFGQHGKSGGPFQPPADLRQGAYSNQSSNALSQYGYGGQPQSYGQQQGYGGQRDDQRYDSGRHPAPAGQHDSEPLEKRARLDLSGNSSALDLLKQEYAEEEQPQAALASLVQPQLQQQAVKVEPGFAGMQHFGQQIILDPQRALVGHSLYGQAIQAQMTAYGNATQAGLSAAAFGQGVLAQSAQGQPPPPPADLYGDVKALRGHALGTTLVKQEIGNLQYAFQGSTVEDKKWQEQQPQPTEQYGGQRRSGESDRGNSKESSFQDNQNRNRSHGYDSYNERSERQNSYGQSRDSNYGRRQDQSRGYRDQGNDRRGQDYDKREQGRDGRGHSRGDSRGDSRGNDRGYQDRRDQGRDRSHNDSRSSSQSYRGGRFDGGGGSQSQSAQDFEGPPSRGSQGSDSGDKPKRERRRPSKWDTPDESNSPTQAAAESGVSQEVMAKVAAIQQKLQQQDPDQQQPSENQEEQQQWNQPSETQEEKSAPQPPVFEQKPDMGSMPPMRGGFGGRPPRPPMGGRGGPGPGQRPPFRPMGPDQQFRGPPPGGPGNQPPPRFGGPPPGDPRFGPRGPMGPGGPPGMGSGGPPGMGPGGPGMGPGGPPGMGPGGPCMGPRGPRMGPGGPGMGPGGPPMGMGPGGRPPMRPRGPNDQGGMGMRGGRPPFGGRGPPPPFGGRGMPPRGPRGPGRWPRPN
ncbi:hypothetical protein FSP39_018519 [Pinctada imbricata]|uniref:B30.2/SPRY domain-containing protein n=1 Tax=Pinctada imbricata TaxID=66713 RepID=A0AA88Y048_PINIB|nr:hypothetical protein FSP39_018519 [Pinctada imbricata]